MWDDSRVPTEGILALRLLLAAALGGAVGLEREVRDQPAGFRTHILVSLGSCLFAVVSAYGFQVLLGEQPGQVTFDPTRIAAQIVSGIGFLGAGAILRYGATVRGLTTAASLWVVAAIGLAVAIGSYWVAVTTTAITVAALWGLKHVRGLLVRGLRAEHEEITLEVDHDVRVDEVVTLVSERGGSVRNLRLDEEGEARTLSLFVRFDPGATPEELVTGLGRVKGVRNVDWSR